MKKLSWIVVLGLLLSGNAYAGQKIIYLGGSSWKMDDGKDKDFTFSEGGSCEYSYINLWRSTYKDCQWQQEGPKVKIVINKGYYIIDGYISGQNFKGRTISKSHGTGTIRGYVTYHEKVYKNWISKEERERLAEQKRIAEEKKRQDEYQKNLQKKVAEYEKQKKLDNQNKINKTKNSNNKTNRYIEIFFLIIIAPIIIITAIRFIYWPFFRDWIYKPYKDNPERFIKRAAAILFGLAILGSAMGGGGDYGCEPRFFQEGVRC